MMLRIDIHHLVCYGSHFESKMAAKIQKSSNGENLVEEKGGIIRITRNDMI
jgi:hypothetical protein